MKAFKVEVLVLGFEDVSEEQVRYHIEDAKHIHSQVMDVKEVDIGEWSDDHPLNNRNTVDNEYYKLFFNEAPEVINYVHGKRFIGLKVCSTEPIYIDCNGLCDLDHGTCSCDEESE